MSSMTRNEDGLDVQRVTLSAPAVGESQQPMLLGFGDLTVSAWGEPVFVQPQSLFHGLWTFDIPRSMWIVEEDTGSGLAEVAPDSVTAVTSSGGAAQFSRLLREAGVTTYVDHDLSQQVKHIGTLAYDHSLDG